jgi:predicted flap endonuclease-1-like 5' DNA nuclease
MFLTPVFSAPIDIMIMLLGAFCIGYGIAWLIRRVTINDLRESVSKHQQEIRNLHISLENLDLAKDKLQEELNQCTENQGNMVNLEELQRATSELRKERERSETARNSLIEIESAHEALKQELQLKIDQMMNPEEANKLRAEINRLRVFNATLEEEIKELEQKVPREVIKSAPEVDSAVNQEHSEMAAFVSSIGIKAASFHEKDDLKKISGVGPFIEQKLHRLGIFTYDQIASMTHEQVERINEAIEFFPGRIQRDDWVGQARVLGSMD